MQLRMQTVKRAPFKKVLSLFARRLKLPLLLFLLFTAISVGFYIFLEGLSFPDALFWISHPHAIHPEQVKTATKVFALFVYAGVFFFQVWVAERVLVTVFGRDGLEAWGKRKESPWSGGMRSGGMC
jgi:hypothetical protein